MKKYLIDSNLPYYFQLWNSEEYIDPKASDRAIWEYGRNHQLTIITKDSDFYSRILVSSPPPKVIHIKLGNMRMKHFHDLVVKNWDEILEMNAKNKLVNVYVDRIEGID